MIATSEPSAFSAVSIRGLTWPCALIVVMLKQSKVSHAQHSCCITCCNHIAFNFDLIFFATGTHTAPNHKRFTSMLYKRYGVLLPAGLVDCCFLLERSFGCCLPPLVLPKTPTPIFFPEQSVFLSTLFVGFSCCLELFLVYLTMTYYKQYHLLSPLY